MSMAADYDDRQLKSFFNDRRGPQRTETLNDLSNYVKNCKDGKAKFVMLWGASDKTRSTAADKDGLLYLLHFLKRVEDIYRVKAYLTLIFTDTHAFLNGYHKENYGRYIDEIKYHIRKHGYDWVLSSDLDMLLATNLGFKDANELVEEIIRDPITRLNNLQAIPADVIEAFARYASRHCIRIARHKSGLYFKDVEAAAMGYLYLAMLEKQVVTERFRDSAFITYMSREDQLVLPDLTIVRLYSIQSGLRTRPWFIYE